MISGWELTTEESAEHFMFQHGGRYVAELCERSKKGRDFYLKVVNRLREELLRVVAEKKAELTHELICNFLAAHQPTEAFDVDDLGEGSDEVDNGAPESGFSIELSPYDRMGEAEILELLADSDDLKRIPEKAWSLLDIEAVLSSCVPKLSPVEKAMVVFWLYADKPMLDDPFRLQRLTCCYAALCLESGVSSRARRSANTGKYERRNLSDLEKQTKLLSVRSSRKFPNKKALHIELAIAMENGSKDAEKAGRRLFNENRLWADILAAGIRNNCPSRELDRELEQLFDSGKHDQVLSQKKSDKPTKTDFLQYCHYLIETQLRQLNGDDRRRIAEEELPF